MYNTKEKMKKFFSTLILLNSIIYMIHCLYRINFTNRFYLNSEGYLIFGTVLSTICAVAFLINNEKIIKIRGFLFHIAFAIYVFLPLVGLLISPKADDIRLFGIGMLHIDFDNLGPLGLIILIILQILCIIDIITLIFIKRKSVEKN